MRFFTFGDSPLRDYCVGVADEFDWVASKNAVHDTFGGGKEIVHENKPNLKLLGVIRPGPRGPTFVASLDGELSPPTAIEWGSRPTDPRKGPSSGPLG